MLTLPDAFLTDIPNLSDTELRIMIVVLQHVESPMTIHDMQQHTGRSRQVYNAVKSLEQAGRITRILSDRGWIWQTTYQPIPVPVAPTPVTAVVEEPKPRRGRKPRAELPAKPISPQQHPAVQAYCDVVKRKPSNVIAEQIIEQVTDVNKWTTAVKTYVMKGWNPLNIDGMLKLYRGEINPDATAKKRVLDLSIAHQPPDEAQRQWERYLQEND